MLISLSRSQPLFSWHILPQDHISSLEAARLVCLAFQPESKGVSLEGVQRYPFEAVVYKFLKTSRTGVALCRLAH